MFKSVTHQPQRLTPESYFSQDIYEEEREVLFEPAWHFVASEAEFPREGSFVTRDVLGRPLILWRQEGEFHAFLNVCSHRYSPLTLKPTGTLARLKCQYHGWEYDCTGCPRKIPDAVSFRPLQAGNIGLKKYPLTKLGQLLFISFASSPPPLESLLGAATESVRIHELFDPTRRLITQMERVIDMNWKVKIENTIESYHVDCIHPKTFGKAPPAEHCQHEMSELRTDFITHHPRTGWSAFQIDSMIQWWMNIPHDFEYRHILVYPHIMFGKAGIFSWVETITPISPTQSLLRLQQFCQRSRWRNPISWGVSQFACQAGSYYSRTAMAEDLAVLEGVQRGLQSLEKPTGGLISVREERISHFQEYIACNISASQERRLSSATTETRTVPEIRDSILQ